MPEYASPVEMSHLEGESRVRCRDYLIKLFEQRLANITALTEEESRDVEDYFKGSGIHQITIYAPCLFFTITDHFYGNAVRFPALYVDNKNMNLRDGEHQPHDRLSSELINTLTQHEYPVTEKELDAYLLRDAHNNGYLYFNSERDGEIIDRDICDELRYNESMWKKFIKEFQIKKIMTINPWNPGDIKSSEVFREIQKEWIGRMNKDIRRDSYFKEFAHGCGMTDMEYLKFIAIVEAQEEGRSKNIDKGPWRDMTYEEIAQMILEQRKTDINR